MEMYIYNGLKGYVRQDDDGNNLVTMKNKRKELLLLLLPEVVSFTEDEICFGK